MEPVQGRGGLGSSDVSDPGTACLGECPGCCQPNRDPQSLFGGVKQNLSELLESMWSQGRPGIKVLVLIGLWSGKL